MNCPEVDFFLQILVSLGWIGYWIKVPRIIEPFLFMAVIFCRSKSWITLQICSEDLESVFFVLTWFIILKRGNVINGGLYLRECVCSRLGGKTIPLIKRGSGPKPFQRKVPESFLESISLYITLKLTLISTLTSVDKPNIGLGFYLISVQNSWFAHEEWKAFVVVQISKGKRGQWFPGSYLTEMQSGNWLNFKNEEPICEIQF